MRRLRLALAVALVVAVAGLVAGCGGSDPDEAKTPANAPTITNGDPPKDDGGSGAGEGDVAAGKTAFEDTCQDCHTDGGSTAGPGPVLVDRGLETDAIRNQIVNGSAGMPGGLVKGADLDNVVAFVASLQGDAAAPPEGEPTASADPGKAFFEGGSCQGCHPAGGNEAGIGPKLAGAGLDEEGIRTQIVNGSANMPAGLASGDDLENVVKYVLSLQ